MASTIHMNDGKAFEVEEATEQVISMLRGSNPQGQATTTLVRFTREDGGVIYINAEAVAYVVDAEDPL